MSLKDCKFVININIIDYNFIEINIYYIKYDLKISVYNCDYLVG